STDQIQKSRESLVVARPAWPAIRHRALEETAAHPMDQRAGHFVDVSAWYFGTDRQQHVREGHPHRFMGIRRNLCNFGFDRRHPRERSIVADHLVVNVDDDIAGMWIAFAD